MPDRAEMDNIVFDILRLSIDELKDVYRAVKYPVFQDQILNFVM